MFKLRDAALVVFLSQIDSVRSFTYGVEHAVELTVHIGTKLIDIGVQLVLYPSNVFLSGQTVDALFQLLNSSGYLRSEELFDVFHKFFSIHTFLVCAKWQKSSRFTRSDISSGLARQ